MRKSRKTKLITMIALVVAILGMSIGFATFSRILTISSKATVDPNRDSHKLVIYGFVDPSEAGSLEYGDNIEPDFTKWSKTSSMQLTSNDVGLDKYSAVIDNNNFTISNISANFSTKSENFSYIFAVRNEGGYDVYLTDGGMEGTTICTALGNTTQTLVDNVCGKMIFLPVPINPETGFVDSLPYKIEPGQYVELMVIIGINNITEELDGPFEVVFPDVKLEFSDVLPEVEEELEE